MKARIYNYKTWVTETDPQKLAKVLSKLLKECKFSVLAFNDYHFEPQGYSAVWLISESHCAVHTWPEEDKSYIELSSCNGAKQQKFIQKISKIFCEEGSTKAEF